MKRILLILALLSASLLFAQTATPPSLGDGSSGNPYQIETLDNLYWLSTTPEVWGLNFKQTEDIDASSTSGWSPIGNETTKFTGSYDGNGHTIDKLYIGGSANGSGFFGYTSGASISYLGLTGINVDIRSGQFIGGLIGEAQNNSNISKCYVSGSVSGQLCVGGLVGRNTNSAISDCYSTASVYAEDHDIGGLIGNNIDGTISNSYSTGSVSKKTEAGGLIGGNPNGLVTNSFWDTETSGQSLSWAGGTGKTTTEMKTQSTFTGWDFSNIWKMNAGNYPELRGGFTLTIVPGNGTVTQNPDQTGYSSGTQVILTAAAARGYTFTGWSGDASGSANPLTVTMNSNKNITANYSINSYTLNVNSANGTVEKNPVQASYVYGTTVTLTATPAAGYTFLNWTGYASPSSANPIVVTITGNINITANYRTSAITDPNAVAPSGSGTSADPYQISTLNNLYWIADQVNNKGFVSSGVHFSQTGNIDASATSGWFPDDNGGYSGWDPIGNGTTLFSGVYDGHGYAISGIYVNRETSSGLFGEISGAAISSLGVTSANIDAGKGSSNAGGITGKASSGSTIRNCFVTGSISGGARVGGIVGNNVGSTITNCYSRASVNVEERWAGGIVGYNDNGTIDNCYSTGSVDGGGELGGLVGANSGASTGTTSFWDTETSGQPIRSAVGVGKTTTEMKTQSTFTGWDFTSIWQMNGVNYPELRIVYTQYTVVLSSSPAIGGTTSGGGTFNSGTSVTVTAAPAAGYTFSKWTENGVAISTNPSYQFEIAGNRTLAANFALIPSASYTVALSSSPAIGGTAGGAGTFVSGTSVTVTAVPAAGYVFTNWTEGGVAVSASSSYAFTIISNRTLIANFSVIPTANTGCIAGAGYINSPAGSFVKTLTFTGKGYFSFAAAYIGKNLLTPTGLVEFLLKSNSLFSSSVMKFSSANFEVLIVSGSQATLKGTGTVNGAGGYGFLLSIIDGKLFTGNKLRLKIWNNTSGALVYDNQKGAGDDAAPITAVTGVLSVSKPSTSSAAEEVTMQQVIEEEVAAEIPAEYEISQNYPNPFNPTTVINFGLPQSSYVTLKIYDMTGKEIRTLVNNEKSAGVHTIQWDGNNDFGSKVSSGTYIYRIQAGSFIQNRKMILMK